MLREILFADLEPEIASTRRVLDRLPDDRFGWRPHDRSWTLGELATHITNLLQWQLLIIGQDELDLAAPQPPRNALPDRVAVLEEYDASAAALRAAVGRLDDDRLRADWTLRAGDHVISRQPRAVSLRMFGVSHMIHHRGQLGVYLRLLDVAVPGVYGPTADDAAQ
ncbi:MAG TPA: DinB family protein [Longimicrobiales bacterium]|nr:DinB family protein [Longimicrobiales bacterium]